MSDELPPKPWETLLASVLSNALSESEGQTITVTVEGRAAYVEWPDVIERCLIPEEVLDRAIGDALTGNLSLIGTVVLDGWNDEIGSRPVDDGLTWAEDGHGGHWCLEPETCALMRGES